jgi:hypothetical protein
MRCHKKPVKIRGLIVRVIDPDGNPILIDQHR